VMFAYPRFYKDLEVARTDRGSRSRSCSSCTRCPLTKRRAPYMIMIVILLI